MHGRAILLVTAAGFLAGAALIQCLPELPHPAMAVAAFALSVLVRQGRVGLALAALGLGAGWTLLHASSALSGGLDPDLERVNLQMRGVVVGVPEDRGNHARFRLKVASVHRGDRPVTAPRMVRLGWFGERPDLVPGETWLLEVRLRRPHGFRNPGGFDYEGWLFREGIGATGHVRASAENRRLREATGRYVDRARMRLDRFVAEAVPKPAGALLRALSVGLRDGLDDGQWEVLRRTGTAHLVAISGLHVGMVAGLVWFLAGAAWRLAGTPVLWVPARTVGALAGLLAAAGYAALAGFSVPTQRALLMLAVVVGAMAMRRPTEPLNVLAVVLLVVLVHDPLSVLSPALWLSFGAVASIALVIWGRCAPEGSWVRFARVQTGVTIGLLPILVATFQGASLASPVANAVAIPVVGMAVVPLTLAGVLASAAGASTVAVWLLGWAGWVLERLWPVLAWLSELPMAWITRSPPPTWALVVAAIGVVLLLMPRGFPGRRAGACLLLPLLLAPAPRPAEGELWLTVLDVGQGLAVVARTASATLLFDTGARFSPRFDAGSAVVVPYLAHAGVNRVDKLVISHADNDHIGGKDAVLAAVAVGTRLGGEPQYMTDARACRDGQGWEWDGVRFRMLYPDRADLSANDASCVLRIESPHGSVLLTGDIERAGEHALVRRHGGALQSDVLVVPHHGSRTSSTPALLNAVRPALAVNSSGAGNAFGHPHPEVVARYETREIAFVDTADSGAVRLRFREGGRELRRYRETHRRYWHADR